MVQLFGVTLFSKILIPSPCSLIIIIIIIKADGVRRAAPLACCCNRGHHLPRYLQMINVSGSAGLQWQANHNKMTSLSVYLLFTFCLEVLTALVQQQWPKIQFNNVFKRKKSASCKNLMTLSKDGSNVRDKVGNKVKSKKISCKVKDKIPDQGAQIQ